VIEPEGTYLVWIDFRKLGMDAASLKHFLRNEARVALDDGGMFGAEGEGFKRINIAAPLAVIAEALERIEMGIRRTRKVP
jgi:cystathionine beta-lyase